MNDIFLTPWFPLVQQQDLYKRLWCVHEVERALMVAWWGKMLEIGRMETLRIRLYVLRKGEIPYIPILFGWDWNPKNPIRSGGVWIFREREILKFT